MATRTPFVGGNWKMHTTLEEGRSLARSVVAGVDGISDVEVAIFPPACYLLPIMGVLGKSDARVMLGAQNCYPESKGAFTGEISPLQVRDCGGRIALVGHSERRHVLGESDEFIARKVRSVLEHDLICLLCIGETLEQRERGETDAVNEHQLRTALAGLDASVSDQLIIAYEPVWAIGTGRTASAEDAQQAQRAARGVIADLLGSEAAAMIRILYGGSVKAANAEALFSQEDIDGGLIGGASLVADEFVRIVEAACP